MEGQLTEAQSALPKHMLIRDFDRVGSILYDGQFWFEREVADRVGYSDEPVVVLDAACGSGAAIEEIQRQLPDILEDITCVRYEVQAIGIDINPVPHIIPGDIMLGSPLSADIRTDDICTLSTIPDNSVDVGYSISGLDYVPDTLRAFEAGYRVLKPGGVMIWRVPLILMSQPNMFHIIESTPGARDIFWPVNMDTMSDYRVEVGYMRCDKPKDGRPFDGFPFELVSVNNDPLPALREPHCRFASVGVYEPTNPSL